MNQLVNKLRGGKVSPSVAKQAAKKLEAMETTKATNAAKDSDTTHLLVSGAETVGAYGLGVALEARYGAEKMKFKGYDLRAVGGAALALFGAQRSRKRKRGGRHAFALGVGLFQAGMHSKFVEMGTPKAATTPANQPAALSGAVSGDPLDTWTRDIRVSDPVAAARI